jgi:hypothetical protein
MGIKQTRNLTRAVSIAAALLNASAVADSSERVNGTGPYAIERYTVDTGGGVSSGGDFSLQGTIGQIDAGPTLFGNPYGVQGGFWPGLNGPAFIDRLFRDRFEAGGPGWEDPPLEGPR